MRKKLLHDFSIMSPMTPRCFLLPYQKQELTEAPMSSKHGVRQNEKYLHRARGRHLLISRLDNPLVLDCVSGISLFIHTYIHIVTPLIPEGVGRGAHYGTLCATTDKFSKKKWNSGTVPDPEIKPTPCPAVALAATRLTYNELIIRAKPYEKPIGGGVLPLALASVAISK
ncbi:hypothetical protein SFRURICE_014808 [Spodoptera frugiperda]|nr:hypothetical protein SFRURICE_014808 [Spodoptera frugiperda]